jgi:hypothetical protein
VATKVTAAGVSVGVAAAVSALVGGSVAVERTVPVGVAAPLYMIVTFPRLQATTVRMMAEIAIRIVFVVLFFI